MTFLPAPTCLDHILKIYFKVQLTFIIELQIALNKLYMHVVMCEQYPYDYICQEILIGPVLLEFLEQALEPIPIPSSSEYTLI